MSDAFSLGFDILTGNGAQLEADLRAAEMKDVMSDNTQDMIDSIQDAQHLNDLNFNNQWRQI